MNLSTNLPRHMDHHTPAQPSGSEAETEVVVAQYSPTWIALVQAGCPVRSGNIIDTAEVFQ